MKKHLIGIASAMLLAFARPALADGDGQTNVIPESTDDMKSGATETGWHPLLKASASFALGHTDGVPGTVDGLSINFGYLINAGLGFLNETREHEWANTLAAQLSYSKTPAVDSLLKSLDVVDFKSSYLYHIPAVPWLGPFVSFRLTAPMLPGYDARATDTQYIKLERDETLRVDGDLYFVNDEYLDDPDSRIKTLTADHKLTLTGAFAPLTLKEAVGLFAMPVDRIEAKLDFRAGFGAWETFVRDGFYIDDNKDTTVLELRRLQDAVQLGPEFGVALTGTVKQIVTYGLAAQFMQPVYNNADTDLEGADLMNMEFTALLGVKAAEWLSIDYQFSAVKQPLLVDQWQIQNGLLVSLTFNIVGGEAPPPPPCECPKCETAPEPAPAPEAAPETAPETAPAAEAPAVPAT